MVEIENVNVGFVIDAFDSGQAFQHFPDLRPQPRIGHIDMSDLMIGNGKRFRDGRVQQFATVLLPHRHKSGVAKRAIDVDRTVDFGNAVFRQHDNGSSAGARRIGKIAGDRIDFGQRFSDRGMSFIRTEALQVIIQMRQISQCESRIIFGHH